MIDKRFLDGAFDAVRDMVGQPASASPGFSIPRYDVFEKVGEGAMSVVYRGRDRQLGREVAIKVLRETFGAEGDAVERFHREAKVAASLSHPGIVSVYDAGAADGRFYLVMELVRGRSLADAMKDRAFGRAALVRCLLQAADGVGAAHAKGIVHRDLKPANLLVSPPEQVKVGDFGLARIVGSELALTRSGAAVGTPLYMAPEQVKGRVDEISPRTDVYALGAILYEILTGSPPHHGETVTDLYARIVGDDPAEPRRRDSTIPRDLEIIALKALEKEPERRYASAGELADDLRRYLSGEHILAKPPSSAQKMIRRLRRHRTAAAVAATLLIAVPVTWALFRGRTPEPTLEQRVLRASARIQEGEDRARRPGSDPAELRTVAEEARRVFEEAAAADPANPRHSIMIARAWELAGREDRAEEAWREIAVRDATGAASRQLVRLICRRACLERAADPGFPPERRDALAKEVQGAILQSIQKGGLPKSVEFRAVTAMMRFIADDRGAVSSEVASLDPKDATPGVEDLHWMRGMILQGGAALEAFDSALRIEPLHPGAKVCRALNRRDAGDLEGAAADLSAAVAAHPALSVAWAALSDVRQRQGRRSDAVDAMKKAIQSAADEESKRRLEKRLEALAPREY